MREAMLAITRLGDTVIGLPSDSVTLGDICGRLRAAHEQDWLPHFNSGGKFWTYFADHALPVPYEPPAPSSFMRIRALFCRRVMFSKSGWLPKQCRQRQKGRIV